MSTSCGQCGGVTAAFLCKSCTAHLASDLDRLPWLDEQVKITQHGGGKLGGGSDGGGFRKAKKDVPLPPYRPDADHVAYQARLTVTRWATTTAKAAHIDLHAPHHGPTCPACRHGSCAVLRAKATFSTASLARFLAVNLHALSHHPDAATAYRALTELASELEAKINRPEPAFFAGPCDDCGRDLYVRPGAQEATCQTMGCGLVYDVQERRDWLIQAVAGSIIDAPTIAKAVTQWTGNQLEVRRIYEWRNRGRLVCRGHGPAQLSVDSDGRRRTRSAELYRFGDVVALVTAAASKRKKVAA